CARSWATSSTVSNGSKPSAAWATSTAPVPRKNEITKSTKEAHKRHKKTGEDHGQPLRPDEFCAFCGFHLCFLWQIRSMKFPFRSLYLKIFIWFWLAMILINVVLFAAVALTRPTPTRRSWRDLAQTGPNAQKAAEVYEQLGPGALSATLQQT